MKFDEKYFECSNFVIDIPSYDYEVPGLIFSLVVKRCLVSSLFSKRQHNLR